MPANDNIDFEKKVTLNLRMDEAIVLFWYLTREVGAERIEKTYGHAAENHSLQALMQELIPPLIFSGSKENEGIEHAARASLLARHT